MSIDAPSYSNTCAVIVTYHPDEAFPSRVQQIARQVRAIIIVDNHSNEEAKQLLNDLARANNHQLILNRENLGLAAALNQGVEQAATREFSWVLLFDQDTTPQDRMFETIAKSCRNNPTPDRIAIVGCNYFDTNSGRIRYAGLNGNESPTVYKKVVITSGSLLSVAAYRIVGPFRNDFFIDYIDHEYCLRARAKGFDVLMVKKPLMKHALGAARYYSFLGIVLRVTNHSPLRRYYFTRNSSIVMAEYLLREPAWVARQFCGQIYAFLTIIVFEDGKAEKLRQMWRGLCDAIRRRMGRQLLANQ